MADFFTPTHNCWKVAQAERATILIDGENYFRAVRSSMARAKQRIVLLGWDFDARIKMYDTVNSVDGPIEIGEYVNWLIKRNPELHIYILRWDTGAIKTLFRGATFFTFLRWLIHPRIHLKMNGKHPKGAATHQKVVTIDNNTAFCGGIDITENRWDTRSHSEDEPGRSQPDDQDAGPWHDASIVVQGDIASALVSFSENRWQVAGGQPMRPVTVSADCWPQGLEPDFENVDLAIARTEPQMQDQVEVREIEQLCLGMISTAEKFIYAESQYFASRAIAKAIFKRLSEPDGPEVVIVNPASSEGWLEAEVMDTTRARLVGALLKAKYAKKFRIYHPVNEAGSPIYVHAKILIIDDRMLKIGSSNFNNRSMGFDTECDIALHASDASGEATTRSAIASIRDSLLAEHLGVDTSRISALITESESIIDAIGRCRGIGRTLRDYQFPDMDSVEEWLSEHDVLNDEENDDEIERTNLNF